MRRPGERDWFACRRCGASVTEWGGMCRDCQAVIRVMGETERWKSDYSKAMRRAMGRRIRMEGGAVIDQPRRDRQYRGYEMPVRDQPQPRQEPVGYDESESA